MKKGFILILCLFCLASTAISATSESYPRIALVLSGGIVTRGLSEIGVIKALEEEHIPISYVAGTSMGSVLGSLLAQGYSAAEIEDIARSIDWIQAFVQSSDYKNLLLGEKEKFGKYSLRMEMEGMRPIVPRSLVNEQRPAFLFTEISIRALNITDFNKFKIPFRANATDLETGKEKVFSGGYLPKVLEASAAVPMMLSPVEIDGHLYVDGGAVDNLPVELVKEFKPDIIIAVNLGADLRKKEELNSLFSVLSQNLSFLQKESAEKHRRQADILIEPDISKYSFADFGKIEEIIDLGYQAAKQKMPELKKMIAQKGGVLMAPERKTATGQLVRNIYINGNTLYPKIVLAELVSSETNVPYDPKKAASDRQRIWQKYFFDGYKLAEVEVSFEAGNGKLCFTVREGAVEETRFSGAQNFSDFFLRDKIRALKIFNIKVVSDNVDLLYSTGFFENVGFTLLPGEKGTVLVYTLKEKNHNSVAIGLRYDTYQQLSLLSDLNLNFSKGQNFQQTISAKIGNEYNFQLITGFWPRRFGQNLLGEFSLFYFNKSQDLYSGSNLDYTFHYLTKGARLGVKLNIEPLGRISSGIDFSEVYYEKIFSLLPNESITKLFLKTRLDFLDEPIFPSSGVAANFEYYQGLNALAGNFDFSKMKVDLEGYLPLPWQQVIFAKSKLYLGRGNVPLSERFRLGGEENLVGYGRDQFIGKDVAQLRLGCRLPLSLPESGLVEGVYLSLFQDLGIATSDINDLKNGQWNAGYGAEMQFNTILGLASKLSLGFGQKTALFFSIGNEF